MRLCEVAEMGPEVRLAINRDSVIVDSARKIKIFHFLRFGLIIASTIFVLCFFGNLRVSI